MQLYFAGGESWSNLLLSMGVKHQLLSFYYFRSALYSGRGGALSLLARLRKARDKGYRFILDSGAFTYQTKAGKTALPKPEEYFREYYDFVCEHHDIFAMIAELDIDNFVKVDSAGNPLPKEAEGGEWIKTDRVDGWTNELLDLPQLRSKIMPVYHSHRGGKWLRDWLLDTRSPLIGFSSDVVEGLQSLIAQAHRFGKFVHGFGVTRIKTDAKYWHFDSVDSSSWIRADKYGITAIFRNGKWIILDHLHKADRRIYKAWYESWGLNWAKIAKDDLEENRLASIIAWRELANNFERQWFVRSSKYPYLYQLHLDGTVPSEHPLLSRMRLDGKL